MKELMRNAEGYNDPTPYNAIKNMENGGATMEFRKGEIFEMESKNGEVRYALVVSSDERAEDKLLNVIVMNDRPVGRINVPVVCHGIHYADCGYVSFTSNERLGNFVRKATDKEIAEVDAGIMKSLGIENVCVAPTDDKSLLDELKAYKEAFAELKKAHREQENKAYNDTIAIRTERDLYKSLYDQILERLVAR